MGQMEMCCVLKSKNVYFTWKYAHQNMGHPAAFGPQDSVMEITQIDHFHVGKGSAQLWCNLQIYV